MCDTGTRPDMRAILEDMPWFRRLPETRQSRIAGEAYETRHDRHEYVAHVGDPSSSWIGVASGLLKLTGVHRNGQSLMLTMVPPGSWVGEGSVMKNEVRRYDVVAITPSRVVHLPGPTFRWLLHTDFDFAQFMLEHLNERLGQYIRMVESDRLTDPVARLARAISSLFNPVLYPKTAATLQFSQVEFGELAGLSRQSINTAIKELERRGMVRAEYGALVVLDLKGLQELDG